MQQASHPTVILGGGFAGLFTALHLSQQNYCHPIILIEQRERFSFKPLLYELLSGELHSEQAGHRSAKTLAPYGAKWELQRSLYFSYHVETKFL